MSTKRSPAGTLTTRCGNSADYRRRSFSVQYTSAAWREYSSLPTPRDELAAARAEERAIAVRGGMLRVTANVNPYCYWPRKSCEQCRQRVTLDSTILSVGQSASTPRQKPTTRPCGVLVSTSHRTQLDLMEGLHRERGADGDV